MRSARGGVDNFVDGGARVGGGPRAPDGARLLRLVQVVHRVEHVVVLAAHSSEARLTAERTAHSRMYCTVECTVEYVYTSV